MWPYSVPASRDFLSPFSLTQISGNSQFSPPYNTPHIPPKPNREKHCQDFIRLEHVDEKLPQINVMWIASLSLLPFSFVVLFVPTTTTGHLIYLGLWVVVLLLVGGTSYMLSASARRLSTLHPEDREYQGWVGRDKTLCVSLFQVGLVIVGASLIAWEEHLDILTDDYLRAFRPGHVRAAAIVWVVGLLLFWFALAGRMNFRLLQLWLGRESPVLFEGAVPRVRVEIFSDGVYAASATGLMIELLNGLLHAQEGGHNEEGGGEGGTVWPGLINYIYCFHIVAVLHRSHQNIVAKIQAFRPGLLAINCLVCLSVAFIPTLSTILDVSWHHDSASLTTGAAFLLCASLLLLLLLTAALRAAPMAEAPEGMNESADALLSEMLGRPLARGTGVISVLTPSSLSMMNQENDEEDDDEEDEEDALPKHAPRLFQDPSCLPRGGGVELLKRLQKIRDEYEIGSACILPAMALFLTVLTASLQLVGHESPFVPIAFLLTFFVYSVEHRVLRPRAAKQIRKIQRQLRHQQQQHQQGGLTSSRSHVNKGPPPLLQSVREESSSFTSSVGSSVGEAAAEEEAKEERREDGGSERLEKLGQQGFGEEGGREDEVKEEGGGLARQGRLRSWSGGEGGEGEKHVHFK